MPLACRDVRKDYPTRSGSLAVLAGVSLTLDRGDAMAVTGPSGSGKSTLLHILGTLDTPTAGSVDLDGVNPFALGDKALAAFRNAKVGFVFQDHHLLPQCTVLENVLIPTLVTPNADRAKLESDAKELLNRVELGGRLDHRPAELSGGERQRTAVARALILKPTLLLADEPTGNLDRTTAAAVGELLLELHRQTNTILVVVTHSPDLANRLPKRMEMTDGKLVTC
jgi:lipoprotein-releasing system ATP-binding protein